MELTGQYKYSKAICLTPKKMKLLESLLLKYYEELSYNTTLLNKSTVKFESLDELLQYDNYKKRKILSITVYGKKDWDSHSLILYIETHDGIITNYSYTIDCKYQLSNIELETLLKKDLSELFEKCKLSYWLVGKFTIYLLFVFYLLAVL